MNKFSPIRDFLWVFQAFLRGKVLRQKGYRLQGNFFRLPVPVIVRRITMLMQWWGLRPATMEEVVALMNQKTKQDDDSSRIPYLRWDSDKLNLGWDENDWGNYHRFVTIRR